MASALAAARDRCAFPAEGPVTCAVSGGADSLALLALAADAGLAPTAVHVDHRLRPGSDAEADVVRAAAERLGTGFRAVAAPVRPGPDLEARARAARHAAVGPGALYGHTADDQAETVVLALLRGTGLDGLAGMTSEQHPLLAVRRSETRAICEELGLEVVHDPSNADPRFRRNRVRAEVLPLLDDVAERDVVPLLCRLADLARADAELLDALAAELDPSDAAAVAAAPPPLAARALRRWLRPHLGGHPPDAAAVDRLLAVARGEAVGAEVAGGVAVRRSGQRLRVVGPGGRAGGPG
ncbi:MAG: tRNA lysidine(34) synthetase TilS [Acidimicrobiia bacterium]